ncbi:hypothetical protein WB401_32695 [Streptomyces brasiliscabiei]|uniref:Uncharacterized protein n=1 Tax=Streptomyces brasiliscabiei TaxID=2736302 RepID=A0ABU8GJN4_9ACTN
MAELEPVFSRALPAECGRAGHGPATVGDAPALPTALSALQRP